MIGNCYIKNNMIYIFDEQNHQKAIINVGFGKLINFTNSLVIYEKNGILYHCNENGNVISIRKQ